MRERRRKSLPGRFSRLVRRLRRSWLLSNNHYLLPVFLLLAAANGALALAGLAAAGLLYLHNLRKAKLPIDPGPVAGSAAETFVYKNGGDYDLRLDLYRPAGGGRRPLVVFAHGGGWISGYRAQPKNASWCRFLASRGFYAASIDYRLALRHRMDDLFEDFADSISYLRENSADLGYDPSRIILMGLSAGAHLALSYAAFHTAENVDDAATRSAALRGIRGVVAYYCPSDLGALFSDDDKSIFARIGVGSALGTTPGRDPQLYRRWSPLGSIGPRMLPVLAAHGRRDQIVPYRSSVDLIRRLKSLGVPCRFLVHKTGGHGFETALGDYRTTLILEETLRFMRSICGGGLPPASEGVSPSHRS